MSQVSMARVVEAIASSVHLDLERRTVTVGAAESHHAERRDLLRDLGTYIYSAFHVGHPHEDGPAGEGRDEAYEEELVARYADRTTVRQVDVHEVSRDEAIVTYLGLRVRVPLDTVKISGGVASLPIPLISPALSPGFALARGPVDLAQGDPTVRVYFAARSRETGTVIFDRVLAALAGRQRWHAKVASQTAVYPRSDAVTVYLDASEVSAIPLLLKATGDSRDVKAPRSWFALPLEAGASLAWDPQKRGVSFGQHRARVIAQILMAQAEGTWSSREMRSTCLDKGIDPDNIWRHPTSPDLDFLSRPAQEAHATALGTR
jgi:HopA1 effector protein family